MMYKYFFLVVVYVAIFSSGCSSNTDVGNSEGASGGDPAANNAPVPGNPAGNVATPGDGRPVMLYEPAPENSQIAQALSGDGKMYEVRIWRGHPQLLKVEAISVDEKNKALTIILRNTKVYNVTTDRIPNVKLATANQFLELAGVEPSAANPASKVVPKKAE